MPGTITRSPRRRITTRTNYYPNPVLANAVSGIHGGASAFVAGGATGSLSMAAGNWQLISASAMPAGGSRYGFTYTVPLTAAAGQQVSVAWDFALRSGPAPVRLYVDAVTSGGAVAGHFEQSSTAAGGTLSGTLTTTAAITTLRVYVWLENTSSSAAGASSVDVARPVVELAANAGSFFYGGQAASGTTTYAWTGTVNNSPSIQVDDNPNDVLPYVVLDGYDMTRPTATTVIPIPGRTTDAVIMHTASGRRGTLKFVLGTSDGVQQLASTLLVHQAQFVLADADRPAVNMTFVIDPSGFHIALDDTTRSVWVLTVPVVEQ